MWKEAVRGYFKIPKTMKTLKILVRVVGIPSGIRTGHLPNTRQKSYGLRPGRLMER
jgi:hypothetical protein